MLQEGDIIELCKGNEVYANLPVHFLYANMRGVFDRYARGAVTIDGTLDYLAGRYVVYKTCHDGGGAMSDIDPSLAASDGHHVFCERLDDQSIKVDFYQSGYFAVMLPDLQPVGKAVRRWVEPQVEELAK